MQRTLRVRGIISTSVPKHLREVRSLLFVDVSGESLAALRDAQSYSEKLAIVERADHLVYLIDGAEVAAPARRHSLLEKIRLECTGYVNPAYSKRIHASRWSE